MPLSFGGDVKKVNTGFLIYSVYSSLKSITQFTLAFYYYLYTLKKQKCKCIKSIYYCIYCILWLKRASEEYFKHDPAISSCGVTLICSDWCPVPIFVRLRILFPFLLVLSTVLGFGLSIAPPRSFQAFSLSHCSCDSVFQYIPYCIASCFYKCILVSFLSFSNLDRDFYAMQPCLLVVPFKFTGKILHTALFFSVSWINLIYPVGFCCAV